jgi:hypothetical protein
MAILCFLYPPICSCVSYLSARELLFLGLKVALLHSPYEPHAGDAYRNTQPAEIRQRI